MTGRRLESWWNQDATSMTTTENRLDKYILFLCHEILSPTSQRLVVMNANIFDVLHTMKYKDMTQLKKQISA